jgi:hypothetical protein
MGLVEARVIMTIGGQHPSQSQLQTRHHHHHLKLRNQSTQGHVVLNATVGLVEARVIMAMLGQHPHVMKLMEGQCMIVGLAAAAAAVAKEAVTMCADVNMSVKIIPRHAQSCESI